MHQTYFDLEESTKYVFNLISSLPTLLVSSQFIAGLCLILCPSFCHIPDKTSDSPALAAVSLNPARSLAAAQVASTGYSILDTLPLSPFTVRNSVAITPSALSLRSQVMMANSKKCHQKLCKLSLTVSGGESVTWKFLMQHIFSHHTKIDKIKESQGSTHT